MQAERNPELWMQQIKNVVFATNGIKTWSAQYIAVITEGFCVRLITHIGSADGFIKYSDDWAGCIFLGKNIWSFPGM
ncbi:hypothetical protein ACLM45_00880 [Synechococcus sp. A10-1-5-9]|uniref:hypothetical protein n=1 Tax=Synechococcus sp. A10-1-5-9 TaxID=3392295 RepID=UPI0039EC7940